MKALCVLGWLCSTNLGWAQAVNWPEPPMSGKPWTVPSSSKVPESWLTATQALVRNGFADPRGCDYREIEVIIPGWEQSVATHGWVLPKASADSKDFAVCWNGWLYPVTKVGPEVDLAPDVWAMMGQAPRVWSNHHASHEDSIKVNRFHPTRIVLLLLLGEEKLAMNLWGIWKVLLERHYEKDREDPLLMFSQTWLQDGVVSGIRAFCESSDAFAEQRSRVVVGAMPRLRATLETRGLIDSGSRYDPFRIGNHAKRMARDLLRRGQDSSARSEHPWEQLSPEAFVEQMQHATGPWDSFSRRTEVHEAALEIGEALVPPLIDCLQRDTRLSRMQVGHGALRGRNGIVPVAGLAYQILTELLQTRHFGTSKELYLDPLAFDLEQRQVMAGHIRRYWEQRGGVPMAERWYAILQDNQAGMVQWLAAAKALIDVPSGNRMYRAKDGQSIVVTQGAAPMAGEALRAKQSPSVTELLAKRAEDLAPRGEVIHEANLRAMDRSCELAQVLKTWEATAALPTFKKQVAHCFRTWLAAEPSLRRSRSQIPRHLPQMVIELGQSGDVVALDQYAEWFRDQPWLDLRDHVENVFAPFAVFPEHQALRETAEWAFVSGKSPWTPFIGKRSQYGTRGMDDLLEYEELLAVPSYRKYLMRELTNTKRGGELNIAKSGQVQLHVQEGMISGVSVNEGDQVQNGTRMPLTVADITGHYVAQFEDMPNFRLYWPKAKRQTQLKALQQALLPQAAQLN